MAAVAVIKYRVNNGTVKQQAFARSSTCSLLSAVIMGMLRASHHARDTMRNSAHVHVATTSREAFTAI